MIALGISKGYDSEGADSSYWLASRYVYEESHDIEFNMRSANNGGVTWYKNFLWYVRGSSNGGTTVNYSLRPVVSLSSDIKFAEGNGTEGNPYTFE